MISQELRIKELQKKVQVIDLYVFMSDSLIQHLTEGKKKCERNRKREGKFLESVISQCKGDFSLLFVIFLVINPPVR